MATNVDYLIRILGDTKDIDGKFGGLGKNAGLMGAAVAAGAAAAAAGLYAIGDTFDNVTDTIRVGTGATGDALDGLVDVAKNVGTSIPADFDSIATTVADLNTRLGLSGDNLETVASQYLEAGRILGEEVDISTSTAALNAFKIEGDDVSGALDTLFQVSQATGVGMNELAGGVQRVAPALQTLGFSFEDSVALLGSLDKAGLNSEQVMASLSKGLVTLAKDGEEPQEAFQRVTGELQGFIDEGNTAAALDLASQIFGTRGASQFVGALESGVLNMNDLMAATGATGDTILGVGEETMDFAERWQITMNTAMVALEPLATTVFTAIGDALAAAMPTIQAFGDWLSENQWVLQAVALVIGILTLAFIGLTIATWAMNTALLANPITWIILAIVALIAAVVLLVLNWDQVVAWITEVWSGFISWITGVIDGFVSWWNETWARVGLIIRTAWDMLVKAVQNAWSGFWGWITGVGQGLINWWNGLWSGLGNFVGDVFNNLVGSIGSAFLSIVGVVRGPINALIGLINSVINGINSISVTIPDWVPGVGGNTFGVNIPNIPRLATGGVTTGPTLALIGDNTGGQEIVEPLDVYASRLERVALQAAGRGGNDQPLVLELHGDAAALEGVFQMFLRKADGTRAMVTRMGKQR